MQVKAINTNFDNKTQMNKSYTEKKAFNLKDNGSFSESGQLRWSMKQKLQW